MGNGKWEMEDGKWMMEDGNGKWKMDDVFLAVKILLC